MSRMIIHLLIVIVLCVHTLSHFLIKMFVLVVQSVTFFQKSVIFIYRLFNEGGSKMDQKIYLRIFQMYLRFALCWYNGCWNVNHFK